MIPECLLLGVLDRKLPGPVHKLPVPVSPAFIAELFRRHIVCFQIPGKRAGIGRPDEGFIAKIFIVHEPVGCLAIRFKQPAFEHSLLFFYALVKGVGRWILHAELCVSKSLLPHILKIRSGRSFQVLPNDGRPGSVDLPTARLTGNRLHPGSDRVVCHVDKFHTDVSGKVANLRFEVSKHIDIPEGGPLIKKCRRDLICDILLDGIQGGIPGRICFSVCISPQKFAVYLKVYSLIGELFLEILDQLVNRHGLCRWVGIPHNGRGLPQLARLCQLNGNIAQNLSGAVYIPVSSKLICNHAGQRNHLWRQFPPRLRLSDSLLQGRPGAFKSGIENLLRFRKCFLVPQPEVHLRVLPKALP